MKFRLLMVTLLLAVLSAGNCLWIPASHACCQKIPAILSMTGCPDHAKSPQPCCEIQPASTAAALLHTGLWSPEHPGSAPYHSPVAGRIIETEKQLSLRHQAFLKNQSQRYLELGVFLS